MFGLPYGCRGSNEQFAERLKKLPRAGANTMECSSHDVDLKGCFPVFVLACALRLGSSL
jgi:hypothetical protein